MKICNVLNEATGKKSVLHAKLLEVFKDQKQADLYYSKVLGEDFKESFGDWVGNYEGTSKVETGATYDTGEPMLKKKKGTTQYYFEKLDGTALFINKKGLRASFSPRDIKDISKYFLYRFVAEGGSKSFNEYDAEADQSKLLDSIDRAISDYKIQVSGLSNEKARIGLTKRIEKVELFREEFKNELVYQLDSLGQKFKEKITDGEGNVIGEVTEENKGGGINITESITVNPKSTATINTKIFLSQLTSKKRSKEGELTDKKSGYLKTPVFEDFSQVWETLQPLLSDVVTTGNSDGVVSAYSRMREIIEGLKTVKPWAYDLATKLDTLYNGNNNSRYKVYEFVQAFNKNKINYYVTEFNAANNAYTVFNATSTNSRESQILDRWGFRFSQKWLPGGQAHLSAENSAEIDKIENNVSEIYDEWKNDVQLAGKDNNLINEAYQKATPALFQQLRDLGVFGLKDEDINAFILLSGGTDNEYKAMDDLFRGVRFMINNDITMHEKKFIDDEGNGVNPMRTQAMLKQLAKAAAYRELDIAESSILANDNKTYFAYSNPTYINNKINEWKEDSSGLEELAKDPINGNSQWIRFLLASEIENNEKQRKRVSQMRLDELQSGLASSFTSVGKNDGVDNVDISLGDQLNDNITKVLGDKIKKKTSLFPSIIAADKSRRVEFKGLPLMKSGINNRGIDGKMFIPPYTVDLFVGYFEDEYNRMKQVARENKNLPDNEKVVHYHGEGKNGMRSQLFPEFDYDNDASTDTLVKLRASLYNADGTPLESNGVDGFDDNQLAVVESAIRGTLVKRLNETFVELTKLDKSSKINDKLKRAYKEDGGIAAMAGDYLVNGLVSPIEYTKLFSGDPAYYKNLPDLIKRIPSTYTDGLQLALESGDDVKFNVAIVDGVEVSSQYVDVIKKSLKDKSIADAYAVDENGRGGVNTTDAQAWITPRRWRFLKQRLGQWSSLHDSVFEKMESGKELEEHELKVAAQPLKGVYFEMNKGVPTYLKYSQAVLIPSMVVGTPMERLLHKMTHDKDGKQLDATNETHEVITIDGIKVGAIAPTKINEGDTTVLAENFELNTNTLTNKGWKLQQDLPIKSMHETNIGSQIQKNILEGLKLDDTYKVFGEVEEVTGVDLLKRVHDSISSLVNIGAEEVNERLGIKDNKITDKSALYDVIIDEFRSRGGNENIIAALEKDTPFDSIPQIRGRIDSILMSIFNRAMTKISTEGGSYIQVSPFGLEQFDETSNIIKVSDRYDGKGLLPPRKGPDGRTLPGQVMIPHTLAMKLLREAGLKPEKMTSEQWMTAFNDPKTRELVGYRIPNQGMSSNDTLEIVGVLPSTMGDSIIGYDGIPAKTGSDFDIDKMYVMAPNMLYNKKDSKFELITDENKKHYKGKKNADKLIAQNTVLNLYSDILQSPHTYDNMMTSIDSGFLKDDINKLHPQPKAKNLDLFSPITQLKTKMNYMSGKMGVALTANQLVDHVANQSLNISVKANLGMGNVVSQGKSSRTMMDKPSDGRSIADTLSAFLNAYVDIAKDPYVTRGNHNDTTANVSFMLIRAGASLEEVNRYIGQPILKEYVELVKQSESITAKPLQIKGADGELRRATPYEFLRDKYGIKKYNKSQLQLPKITNKQFEDRIVGNPNEFVDSVVLNAFEFHEKKAAQWTDAVLSAKIDVKGAGGSPISMNIAINKIRKAREIGFVVGYDSKFAGTALETYRDQALFHTQNVLRNSDILLSATDGARSFMNTASSQLTRDSYLISEKLGKSLDKGMYSYLMSGTTMMKDNRRNFNFLFTKLPLEIDKLKEANSDNFLIQELEIQLRGGYNFIGINGKNKPAEYQNNIYRAWMDLYEDKETSALAVNLARYAFSQSGFQSNLNQFFTHIPHEILSEEGMTYEVNGFFSKVDDMEMDQDGFLDQFYRHEADNTDVVPRANKSDYVVDEETDTPYGFTGSASLLEKYEKLEDGEMRANPPKFMSLNLGDGEIGLYKLVNWRSEGGSQEDMVPVYARTFKLGYKAGKNKVFEYDYGKSLKKSILPENQFEKDFIKEISIVNKRLAPSIEQQMEEAHSSQENFNEAENIKDESNEISSDEEFNSFKLDISMMKKLNITKKDCK